MKEITNPNEGWIWRNWIRNLLTTLPYNRNYHNNVNQLDFNKTLKKWQKEKKKKKKFAKEELSVTNTDAQGPSTDVQIYTN